MAQESPDRSDGPVRICWLGPGDSELVREAGGLFDGQPRQEWSDRFLTAAGHHLALGYCGRTPAGFVSGVEMTHPDKGTEIFLYELGVQERFRRAGVSALRW